MGASRHSSFPEPLQRWHNLHSDRGRADPDDVSAAGQGALRGAGRSRSEEHTSELQHLGISYAVFCLKKDVRRHGAAGTALFGAPSSASSSVAGAKKMVGTWYGGQKCRGAPVSEVSLEFFFFKQGAPRPVTPPFPLPARHND